MANAFLGLVRETLGLPLESEHCGDDFSGSGSEGLSDM